MPVIGVLAPNPKVFETLKVERDLAALGWQTAHNLRLLFRASAGTNETLPALAANLVGQNVELIIAAGDQAVIAAQRASTAIPIVGICDDMVGSHLVESMARPGGNTTGISILASELDVKRLQLLHELVPQAARIGILADPTTISTRPQLEAAAPALAIELITTLAVNPDEIGTALDHLAGAGLGAVMCSPLRSSTMPAPARDALPHSGGATRLLIRAGRWSEGRTAPVHAVACVCGPAEK